MFTTRSFIQRNPVRWLAGALVATLIGTSASLIGASPAGALTYQRWAIDANTVKVADAQEENHFWDDGDEVQIGVVAFRTVLGSPGTTNAWYVGNELQTHCSGADDGKVCDINDTTGRASFGYVRQIGAADIARHVHPTIIGTIQVAIEEDETPDSLMESVLRNLATITKEELTTASESVTDAQLASASGITAKFKAAAQRIKDRAQPRWYEKVGIFIGSGGFPDDVIDFKITALVAVESPLADYVDSTLAGALGDDGFAGALRSRSVVQRHGGDGAVYYVTSRVGTY